MFWNEDHFEVHRQDARGLFSPVAETVTTEVPIDSDDLSSLAVGEMTGRVLHSLADLNKDGKQDILMHHRFTLRDTHGAPKLPPGSEPQRVTVLIAR